MIVQAVVEPMDRFTALHQAALQPLVPLQRSPDPPRLHQQRARQRGVSSVLSQADLGVCLAETNIFIPIHKFSQQYNTKILMK